MEEQQSKSNGQTRRQRQRNNKKMGHQAKDRDADTPSEATKGYMTKTQMCKFFEEGKCTRGRDCTFAHDESELKKAPDFTKTRMCEKFKMGECNDSNCSFAHNADELRKIDPAIAEEVAALRKQRQKEARESKRRSRSRLRRLRSLSLISGLSFGGRGLPALQDIY